MTNFPMRVLLVEDTRADVLLVRSLLGQGSSSGTVVDVAESTQQARQCLRRQLYSVVLLDLGLPDVGGDGTAFLREIVDGYPGLPVVVLTGRSDTAVVDAAFAAGAQDYILKTELRDRTLERALRYAIARERAERRYRELVEETLGFMCTHDLSGTLQSVNPAAAAALGYERHELEGKRLVDLMPNLLHDQLAAYLHQVRTKGSAQGLWHLLTRSGERRVWDFRSRLYLGEAREGADAYVVGHAQDVTERRNLEKRLTAANAELQAMTDALPLGLFRTNAQGQCTYVNAAYERIAGVDAAVAMGDGWTVAVHPEDRERSYEQWRACVSTGEVYFNELRYQHPTGKVVWVEAHAAPIRIDGEIAGYVGLVEDITARREAETALRQQEAQVRTMADAVPIEMIYIGMAERVVLLNAAAESAVGRPRSAVVGLPLHEVWSRDRYQQMRPLLVRALRGRQAEADITEQSPARTLKATAVPQKQTGDDIVVGAHLLLRDVSTQRAREKRLVRLAEQDPLTRLLNRAGFLARLTRAIERSKDQETLLALLYLDLDGFKQVNDRLGHLIGDQVLVQCAQRLRGCVRSSDVVARLGGDEFVAAMEGLRSREAGTAIAAKLLTALKRPFDIPGVDPISLSASIGIAYDAHGVEDADALIARADALLYEAKRAGRGTFVADLG